MPDSFNGTLVLLADRQDLALGVIDGEAPLLVEALELNDELLDLSEILALKDQVIRVGQKAIAGGGLPEELLALEGLLEVDVEEERREHASLRYAGVSFDEDVAEESLGVDEKAADEVDEMLVSIVLASILKDLEKSVAVDLAKAFSRSTKSRRSLLLMRKTLAMHSAVPLPCLKPC